MARPLTDTDIDALLFGSNSETDEENDSNYELSLMKMKKTQLLTMIQNKHLRRKEIQDLPFADPIYLVGLLL